MEKGIALIEELRNPEEVYTKSILQNNLFPFLRHAGPAIGFLLFLFPEYEEETVTLIKDLMDDIDRNFRKVEDDLREILNELQWSTCQEKLFNYEQNIGVMMTKHAQIIELSAVTANDFNAPVQDAITAFYSAYDNTYKNSGELLADLFEDSVTGIDCLNRLKQYVNGGRCRLQRILNGILELLVEAAFIELTRYQMKNFTDTFIQAEAMNWNETIQTLAQTFQLADDELKREWCQNVENDVVRLSAANPPSTNTFQSFANTVYYTLASKYCWRHFMVVVTEIPSSRYNVAAYTTCGIKLTLDHRVVIVGSVPSNHQYKVNNTAAMSALENTETKDNSYQYPGEFGASSPSVRPATEIYDDMEVKSIVRNRGAIKCYNSDERPAFKSHADRFISYIKTYSNSDFFHFFYAFG